MVFVRKGGGQDDDGGDVGDEQLGTAHRRCEVCRRELLPWESVCPDDGGAGVAPGTLGAEEHDALLARLLAEDDGIGDDEGVANDRGGVGDDSGDGAGGGGGPGLAGSDGRGDESDPSWPSS